MRLIHLIILGLALALSSFAFAQDEDLQVQKKALELVKKYSLPGEKVVVIAVPEEDFKLLFPEDPSKRVKFETKVFIADEESVFKAKISPGGQSTLTSSTPNLRIKKLKNLTGSSKSLAGVKTISGTTRINPLTMDEGYVATKLYQKALNQFGLVPKSSEVAGKIDYFKLKSEYSKIIYVPMNKAGVLLEEKRVNAGLHLVNHHPVKFLADAQTDGFSVDAVGRSRYNIVNVQEKLKLIKADPETEVFSSLNSSVKTAPHRVELSWALDDAKKLNLQKLLNNVYSAPLNYSGEKLYLELSKSMDVEKIFKFLAFNHIIRNGDISDEYFWFTQTDKKTGKTLLNILPQDGDDLLKGVHMFPFDKQQIGLIARDKLKISKDFIYNFEDPLFRTIRNDPYLYNEYLKTYQKMAKELVTTPFLNEELKAIEKQLNNYVNDPEILKRGKIDEIGVPYDKESFSKRVTTINDAVKSNANEALGRLENGTLVDAERSMLAQRKKILKLRCSGLKWIFL